MCCMESLELQFLMDHVRIGGSVWLFMCCVAAMLKTEHTSSTINKGTTLQHMDNENKSDDECLQSVQPNNTQNTSSIYYFYML